MLRTKPMELPDGSFAMPPRDDMFPRRFFHRLTAPSVTSTRKARPTSVHPVSVALTESAVRLKIGLRRRKIVGRPNGERRQGLRCAIWIEMRRELTLRSISDSDNNKEPLFLPSFAKMVPSLSRSMIPSAVEILMFSKAVCTI